MKQVVHLTSAHRRFDPRIRWRECASLQAHGYNVTLIVNDNQPDEITEDGIKILSTGFVSQGRWQRITEGVQRVYKLGLLQDADIYHLHDAELLTIALKLKQHGKKVIFDSHEVYGEAIKGRDWLPAWSRDLLSCAYNQYETYVCKRIDGVIHVGKYDGKDWFAGRSRRFVYVGNYPKLEEFSGLPIRPYSQRKNICFSGGMGMSEKEGLLNILEAAERANTRIFVAGRFLSEEFKKKFEERDIHHIAHYLGLLNRKDVYEMYGECAIGMCIYPDTGGQVKKIENFNTKVYEYMAMEMPIILSAWPYKQKMVEKYRFGLTADPSDVEDIATKIKWLLEHPKDAEEMGKNGKHLLVEQFTWDVAEKELLRLYQELEQDQ